MFRTLPAAFHTVEDLEKLATDMTAAEEDTPTPEDQDDAEENPVIPAGYTYLGQFIDHDLTFDPASSLQRQDDPDGLTDFRTPRFDLDSLYGRGPDDQPYMYEGDGVHMLLGEPVEGVAYDSGTRDLPRNRPGEGQRARALIGDPRNDENSIVSQLQATMIRFHNQVVDFLAKRLERPPTFEEAQQVVRFHYQWVVLHDFLPTIIGEDQVAAILPPIADCSEPGSISVAKPNLEFFHWRNDPFMPVEFSVAAYRFGHSMVRPQYRLNLGQQAPRPGADPRLPIFPDLRGFRSLERNRAVDWHLFFDFHLKDQPTHGPQRIQHAYKIDSSLVNPLGHLPETVVKPPQSLPERNLLRGLRMSLPSGQAVARAMGLAAIPDAELLVGKATAQDPNDNPLPALTSISPRFRENAPLWYYILAEAQQNFVQGRPVRLGPVGGRIVGEVIIGLLWGDRFSFLRQSPCWQPFAEFQQDGRFGMAELIRVAQEGGRPAGSGS